MYTEKELVSFGNHLLSEERRKNCEISHEEAVEEGLNPISVKEALSMVYDSDLENWKEENFK
jgi:hypothetical protein